MKSVLTVWLPVAALTIFTALVILNRRGSNRVSASAVSVNRQTMISESVSSATGFNVIDGDSLKVTFGADIPVSIRLAGIDAPELGQRYGFEAKEKLKLLIGTRTPEIKFMENGKYGRKVCFLLVGQQNLNLDMIKNGFAWAGPDASEEFKNAQKAAQEKALGIWSRKDPIPPWEWRANK